MAKSVPYKDRKFDKAKSIAYNTQYQRDHFDRITFVFPKGYKDIIKEKAANEGISMSEWLRQVVDEKIN